MRIPEFSNFKGGLAIAAALLVAACSSNTGDGLTDAQRQDRDASASTAGLFSFANTLINSMTGETGEPRSISGITPPVSDTDEPTTL